MVQSSRAPSKGDLSLGQFGVPGIFCCFYFLFFFFFFSFFSFLNLKHITLHGPALVNNFAVNTPVSVAKLRTSVFRGPLLVLLPDHQNWCMSLVLVNIKFYIGYDAQTLYLERILPVELKTIPLQHQHEGHAHECGETYMRHFW